MTIDNGDISGDISGDVSNVAIEQNADGNCDIEKQHQEESQTNCPKHRRCIVTRENLPISEMIRFVLSPDKLVTPDIKGKLIGRGMWVKCDSVAIAQAIKINAFAKSAKSQAQIPDELVDLCEKLIKKRILENLSLARRAGFAISGFEKVKEIVKSHQCQVVFSSSGDKSDSAGKLAGMCRMLNMNFFTMLNDQELGIIFGREKATYAGVKKCGIANTIEYEAKRLSLLQNGE